MLRYEILILVTPDVTQDETASIEKYLAGLIKNAKADLISYERWGKYRLAYPVRKKEYGVYYLLRFAVNQEQKQALIKDMQEALRVKFNDLVMRFMVHEIRPGQSLEYTRPRSLEEMPQDVDNLLKENPALMNRSTPRIDDMMEESHGQEGQA